MKVANGIIEFAQLAILRLPKTAYLGSLIAAALLLFGQNGIPAFAKKAEPASSNAKVVKATGYKPVAASKESAKGKDLFHKNQCVSCHTTGASGGCLGPVLSGVGARRTKEFITARISSDPSEIAKFQKLYSFGELMPHPRLAAATVHPIIEYLLTLPEPKNGFSVGTHSKVGTISATAENSKPATSTSETEGRMLVYEKGCISCHAISSVGGQFAPAFDNIGGRRDRKSVRDVIRRSEGLVVIDKDEYGLRGAAMPPLSLQASEIESIVDFLMTLKTNVPTQKNK